MKIGYPLVHWLLSLLVSPIFLLLLMPLYLDGAVTDLVEWMGVVLFYAGSLSLPILFYALCFK